MGRECLEHPANAGTAYSHTHRVVSLSSMVDKATQCPFCLNEIMTLEFILNWISQNLGMLHKMKYSEIFINLCHYYWVKSFALIKLKHLGQS